MPKPPKPVSPEEAGSYFEAMLSSGEFRGSEMYGPVLRILFESWKVDQDATLSEDDLIIKLGAKLTIDEKSFRPTIGRLRLKVSDYGNKSKQPIKFEISKGTRYQLRVTRDERSLGDTVPIILRRDDPGDEFEKTLCEPSSDVLFLALTGHHAVTQHIRELLKQRPRRIQAIHFRVLVWRPTSPAAPALIESLARHLGVDQSDLTKSIGDAWEIWKELERDLAPPLEVYGYSLIPSALAVCNDHRMKVELLPFNLPGGKRDSTNRPAILISAVNHQREYDYFRQWFDDLWFSAMHETMLDVRLDAEVHPHWREGRKALLQERGLMRTE